MSSPSETPVSCPGCAAPHTNDPSDPVPVVQPTWNFADPVTKVVGRFVDSNWTRDWQQPFRTARAWETWVVPERNRVYLKIGSALEAYDMASFISRLESRDTLAIGGSRQDNINDRFLKGDRYFYAEANGTGWETVIVDGQERLGQVDFDDRGLCYLAYTLFGWGIVKDDGANGGNLMKSIYQNPIRELAPAYISVIKTSAGKYYVLAGGSPYRIYDVTNPASPVKLGNFSTYYIRRAKTQRNFAAVSESNKSQLHVYDVDTMISGGAPQVFTAPDGGLYTTLTTDGTNFYAIGSIGTIGNKKLLINILTPDGNGGVIEHQSTYSAFDASASSISGGFLALFGVDPNLGSDVRLYKVSGTTPEEISLNNFFGKYYTNPPAGYVRGVRSVPYHAAPLFMGSKLYMVMSAFGLGDVFEIRAGDTITASIQGTAGGINPAAPARTPGDIYYGDKVAFIATSSAAQKPVAWNFGNPEAAVGADSNIDSGGTTGITEYHQYSGITSLPTTRTVNANALGLTSNVNVTLKAPVARFRILNTQFLFTQPDASSPAPVVLGDTFVDASDGDMVGHYSTWTLDGGAAVSTTPGQGISVGDCGAHILSFVAHYGPNANFASIGSDYALGINPFNYTVRPFAVSVGEPVTVGGNTTFTSITRSNPAAGVGNLTYKWDLLNAAGDVVQANVSNAGSFTIATSSIPNGGKARLTVTSDGTLTGACVGLNVATATSSALIFTDPVINGDCTNGAPPCNFTAGSASGASMTGWTYSWGITPNSAGGTFITGPTNTSSFNPVFTAVGSYTVTLTASNALGAGQPASKAVNVTTAGSACTTMGPTVFVSPGCKTNCTANQSIPFIIGSYPTYPWDCSPTWTFNYTFSDGFTATTHVFDEVVDHAFAAGTYTVKCVISNGSGVNYTTDPVTITVGAVYQPPPYQPPSSGCGTMTAANVFYAAQNAQYQNCLTAGNCAAGQPVTLIAQSGLGYSFSCGTHSFTWVVNGQTQTGQTIQTTFANAGSYPVSLTISNGTQTITLTSPNVIIGQGGGTGSSCPTMNAANVFATYHNVAGTCTQSPANQSGCVANEPLTFDIGSFGYNFECAPHTITWNFKDGGTATGASATHVFANAGSYSVTATISRSDQTFIVTAPVTIAGQAPQLPSVTVDFVPMRTANAHEFDFTPSVDPANVAVRYLWDFGDGASATRQLGEKVTHAYVDGAAEHTVTLRVYDISNREVGTHTETVSETAVRPRAVRRW